MVTDVHAHDRSCEAIMDLLSTAGCLRGRWIARSPLPAEMGGAVQPQRAARQHRQTQRAAARAHRNHRLPEKRSDRGRSSSSRNCAGPHGWRAQQRAATARGHGGGQRRVRRGHGSERTRGSEGSNETMLRVPIRRRESASHAGPYAVRALLRGLPDGPDFAGRRSLPERCRASAVDDRLLSGLGSAPRPARASGPLHGVQGPFVFMYSTPTPSAIACSQRQDRRVGCVGLAPGRHQRGGSPLQGQLALDRISFMGWSMGGGAPCSTAKHIPRSKALITLAGHNVTGVAPGRPRPDRADADVRRHRRYRGARAGHVAARCTK